MSKKIIERARKEAELHKDEHAEQYLCFVETVSPPVGDRPRCWHRYWGVFTEEQHGYQVAEERIPLYPEERTNVERVEWWREVK